MDSMIRKGLKDLTAMQCSDGGWGWFSGWGEHSWPHTTALVVQGLKAAETCKLVVCNAASSGWTTIRRIKSAV